MSSERRRAHHAARKFKSGGASAAARLAHNLGHGARVLVAYGLKAGDDAGAVSGVAVLARLPFAADIEDLDLDADDHPALHGDEIGGRVADRPRLLAPR